ncbi:MAG TPA: hypothetical protein ENJ82_10245, partial [Bacteroidetes bacterium]|nr:hypothetical protein [Bacteroidota bacterium]
MKEDQLYELVQSLTPSEKRYFRLQHQRSEQQGFMRLFDYLEDSDEYAAQDVKAAFPQEKFIRNLAVIKGYLRNSILKDLADFHRQNYMDLQLRSQLDFVQLLHEKGLKKLCIREIRKLKKQALATGSQLVLVETLKWEIKYLRFEPHAAQEIAALRRLLMDTIQAELVEAKASTLFDQAFHLILARVHHPDPANRTLPAQYRQEAEQLLQAKHLGILGRLILLHCLIHCDQMLGAPENVFATYERIIELFRNHSAFAKARPALALKSYRGYLEYCLHFESFAQSEAILTMLATLPLKGDALKAEAEAALIYFRLKKAAQLQQFQEAADFEPEARQLFERFQHLIPASYQLTIWYELSLVLIVAGRYTAAKSWLRSILEEPLSQNRKDIREFARLMQLLVWLQTGEQDLLDAEWRNTERMLKRRGSLSEVNRLLLQFFKKANYAQNRGAFLELTR